jgi:hypothetical protein
MIDDFYSDFKAWVAKPYNEEGDVIDWLLFIGLLTCGTFLWARVINRILD